MHLAGPEHRAVAPCGHDRSRLAGRHRTHSRHRAASCGGPRQALGATSAPAPRRPGAGPETRPAAIDERAASSGAHTPPGRNTRSPCAGPHRPRPRAAPGLPSPPTAIPVARPFNSNEHFPKPHGSDPPSSPPPSNPKRFTSSWQRSRDRSDRRRPQGCAQRQVHDDLARVVNRQGPAPGRQGPESPVSKPTAETSPDSTPAYGYNPVPFTTRVLPPEILRCQQSVLAQDEEHPHPTPATPDNEKSRLSHICDQQHFLAIRCGSFNRGTLHWCKIDSHLRLN